MCEGVKGAKNVPTYHMYQQTSCITWHLHGHSLVGIDILGPFLRAQGQVKYLVVVVDYFTKWVEAKTLATITSKILRTLCSSR